MAAVTTEFPPIGITFIEYTRDFQSLARLSAEIHSVNWTTEECSTVPTIRVLCRVVVKLYDAGGHFAVDVFTVLTRSFACYG